MKKMLIEDHILNIDDTLQRAINTLDKVTIKLCLLVDAQGCLIRTIVDGDLRRAIVAGATMDTKLTDLSGREPVAFHQDTPREELVAALEDEIGIKVVVLVDDARKPVELVERSELQSNILLSPPHLGAAEASFVQQAFTDNWVAPAGPNLTAFEAALSQVSGRDHALALSSGTAALHLALRVLSVGEGDRVYVSDLTFAATVQPIFYVGATPVLIDSEPQSWNMSPQALERKLAKDAKTGDLPAAIILVHIYGQSANVAAIIALADQYDIPVIEDAAESLGAMIANRPSGSHGLLSVYSFNGNKIITTGGGGALVSDRADLIALARDLSTQGRDPAAHYQHSKVAYNYRMSNILAGIGLGQLQMLTERVAQRRAVFQRYFEAFSDIKGLSFQGEIAGSVGNRWLTVISLDPNYISRHPYQLMMMLRAQGIESRPAWKPMHMQPLCAAFELEPHGETDIVSSGLFLQSLCLPSGSSLLKSEQDRIIKIVRQFVET